MGKLNKTEREWQRELSPEEYRITRQKGTEPAFCNPHHSGAYQCGYGGNLSFGYNYQQFINGAVPAV